MTEIEAQQQISADEIALYDRQIRLWGMKAQEKIRTAKVLLVNLRALGGEVTKNLVLAGIGSLTIVDDESVREEDLGAQFFINEGHIGKNRIEAAAPQIRAMNPRVQLQIDTEDIQTKPFSFFGNFDIIISTDLDYLTFAKINTFCRSTKRSFYAIGVHGLYGFIFSDLVTHTFTIEREKPNVPTPQIETSTRRVIHTTTKKENNKLVETVTKQETYTPLDQAVQSKLPTDLTRLARRRKQVPPLLSCLFALWRYESDPSKNNSRYPTFSRPDLERFTALATEAHQSLGLTHETLTSEFIRSFIQNLGAEISPVAAFLGGTLAQDVINVLGQREQPIQNMLVFDGEQSVAPIYALYPQKEEDID